jgi:hypothetical protein
MLVELSVPGVRSCGIGLRRDLIHKQLERRPRGAKHAERSRGAAAKHLGTLVDVRHDRALGRTSEYG